MKYAALRQHNEDLRFICTKDTAYAFKQSAEIRGLRKALEVYGLGASVEAVNEAAIMAAVSCFHRRTPEQCDAIIADLKARA